MVIERAEAKAARLDALAVKRGQQANAFHDAANRISKRFEFGQPILVGHHSERKARRDQSKMHAAMDKAIAAQKAVSYWGYRAEGVERHANRLSDPGVRARRIKKLLKELRDCQRSINHAKICLGLWTKIEAMPDADAREKAVRHYAGGQLKTGSTAPWELWSSLDKGEITTDEAIEQCLAHHEYAAHYPGTLRWIAHILNRLAFERSQLGEVARFHGELTAVILQAFAREQGAHKPEATKTGKSWTVGSTVDLPAHIGETNSLTLDANGWRDLMQSSGYEVPAPKPRRKSTAKAVPLINPTEEDAERLQAQWNQQAETQGAKKAMGAVKPTAIRRVTQAFYSAQSKGTYSAFNTVELDAQGNKIGSSWKGKTAEPVCRVRTGPRGGCFYSADSVVFVEDKPAKALPIEWVSK